MPRSRVAVVALHAVACFMFSEQRALAGEGNSIAIPLYWAIGGIATGAASVPFLVADVVYTAQYRWLPPGWASAQIVIGGGVNAAVAFWGIAMYTGEGCTQGLTGTSAPGQVAPAQPNACGNILPLTLGASVLSVGFMAHGIASLVLYEPEPKTKAADALGVKSRGAYLRWVPDIVVTRDRNTFVAFSGAF